MTRKPVAVTLHFFPLWFSLLFPSLCIEEEIHFLSFVLVTEIAKEKNHLFLFLCAECPRE